MQRPWNQGSFPVSSLQAKYWISTGIPVVTTCRPHSRPGTSQHRRFQEWRIQKDKGRYFHFRSHKILQISRNCDKIMIKQAPRIVSSVLIILFLVITIVTVYSVSTETQEALMSAVQGKLVAV